MNVNNNAAIPCPVCSSQIPFEVNALLRGTKFGCPNCGSLVGIQPESVNTAKTAVEELDKLKRRQLTKI